MTEPHVRLEEAMRARRLELGFKTWRELAIAADISYETLRSVKSGEARPSESTTHGLDGALQWETGEGVEAILAGREPTPTRPPEPTAPEPTVADIAERVAELERKNAEQARVNDELIRLVRARMTPEERRRYGGGGSSDQRNTG